MTDQEFDEHKRVQMHKICQLSIRGQFDEAAKLSSEFIYDVSGDKNLELLEILKRFIMEDKKWGSSIERTERIISHIQDKINKQEILS